MGNGGSRNLSKATEVERALSVALIGVAAAITAGLIALWPGLGALVSQTGARLANGAIILALACLGLSMFFGGRGCAYGPKHSGWNDRFNLQATLGAAAIVLIVAIGGTIFATSEPSPSEKFAAKLAALEARVTDLAGKVDDVSRDLPDIRNRLAAAANNLDSLDRSSTDHSNKLNGVAADIKALSARLDQVEKGVASPKP